MFTGELAILNKLLELTNRVGISPTVASISLHQMHEEDLPPERQKGQGSWYTFGLIDGTEFENDAEEKKFYKVAELLGLDDTLNRDVPDLRDVEAIVDRALSLAPRARTR